MKETQNGHTIEVERVENGSRYEFELSVDGDVVKTATQLEREGYSFEEVPNWTVALMRYGRAYVAGMDA